MTQPTTEGYIPFKGYKTWYKIVGEKEEPGKLPLLLLHGGPGACIGSHRCGMGLANGWKCHRGWLAYTRLELTAVA